MFFLFFIFFSLVGCWLEGGCYSNLIFRPLTHVVTRINSKGHMGLEIVRNVLNWFSCFYDDGTNIGCSTCAIYMYIPLKYSGFTKRNNCIGSARPSRVRCSLQAERYGTRTPVWIRDFVLHIPVHTVPGTHTLAPSQRVPGLFPGGKAAGVWF